MGQLLVFSLLVSWFLHGYFALDSKTKEFPHEEGEFFTYEVQDLNGRTVFLNVRYRLKNCTISFISHGSDKKAKYLQRKGGCFVSGHLQNVKNSYVFLDTCSDQSGILVNDSLTYAIEKGQIFPAYNELPSNVSTEPTFCGHGKYKPYKNSQDTSKKMFSFTPIQNVHIRNKRATETLMVELYIVMDNELFSESKISRDESKALQYVETVVHHLDDIYSELGVRILLVGIEILNKTEPSLSSNDATELLDQFLELTKQKLRRSAPVEFDFIALLSAKTFGGNHVGMAHVSAMCGDRSGAVIQDDRAHNAREYKTSVVLAHEIGHVIGMLHDDAACFCPDASRGCLMHADITQLPTKLSSCSAQTLKNAREKGLVPCLYNVPDVVYNGPICGNGITEVGEVCDCSGKQACLSSKCCTETCQLKHGAKCATGACCHDCQIVKAYKLCRRAQNECDLEEECSGNTEQCPPNLYKQDLTKCGNVSNTGYCLRGQCQSNLLQCQQIWGKTGIAGHPLCFSSNTKGDVSGNCGTITQSTFRQCNSSDKMCGILFCDSPNKFPEFGGGKQRVVENKYNIPSLGQPITCKGTTIDLGPDVPDPGLVNDGSPCFTNTVTKTEGICMHRRCVDISSIPIQSCPADNNGTTCSGHGICNNLDKCWCFHGYKGHHCEMKIVYPGPIKPELTVVHIVVISVCCSLFIFGVTLTLILLIRKKKKKKKGRPCKSKLIMVKVKEKQKISPSSDQNTIKTSSSYSKTKVKPILRPNIRV